MRGVFERFPTAGTPNESQTENDLIWPVLERVGWPASLRQQNLSAYGRADVPDGLLFQSADEKAHANGFAEEWKRYQFGQPDLLKNLRFGGVLSIWGGWIAWQCCVERRIRADAW